MTKKENQPWKRLLTCGQMANAHCVTTKTLRFYQEKGLLEPDYVDEATGYRYYSILQSTKLDMITHLRTMGFSLDEIKEIDLNGDIANLREIAQAQLDHIHEQQQSLVAAENLARELIEDCSAYLARPLVDQPMLEMIPDRHILTFDIDVPDDVLAGNTDLNASDMWEWVVRKVKQSIVEKNWPLSLFRNVSFIIQPDEIKQEYAWLKQAFVFVDKSQGECFEESRILPGGTHAVLYIDQGYSEEGASLDSQRFESLQAFIEENGFEADGQPYCEGICRYQRFFNQGFDSFCRYCIPVRAKQQ